MLAALGSPLPRHREPAAKMASKGDIRRYLGRLLRYDALAIRGRGQRGCVDGIALATSSEHTRPQAPLSSGVSARRRRGAQRRAPTLLRSRSRMVLIQKRDRGCAKGRRIRGHGLTIFR